MMRANCVLWTLSLNQYTCAPPNSPESFRHTFETTEWSHILFKWQHQSNVHFQVAFASTVLLDGGQTLLIKGARVKDSHQGRGVYGSFRRRLLAEFSDRDLYPDLRWEVMTVNGSNVQASGDKFRKTGFREVLVKVGCMAGGGGGGGREGGEGGGCGWGGGREEGVGRCWKISLSVCLYIYLSIYLDGCSSI